ncbi:MAG: ATP synthase subunit I [Candidatus Latescibacterota bacterium]
MSGDVINPLRNFVKTTRKKALILGIILGITLFVFWTKTISFGYLCGAVISLVNFQLMAADAFGMVDKSSKSAKKFILFRYFLRYALFFSALILIITRTDFNIFAVFAGVFTVQVVIIGEKLLSASGITGGESKE